MINPQSRIEQLLQAYLAVAKVNHYMVGIVDPAVTRDELEAVEQLLIDLENKTPKPFVVLALDLVQHKLHGLNHSCKLMK